MTITDLFGGHSVAGSDQDGSTSLAEFVQACERRYIEQTLAENDWRIKETAAALNITRKNLWEKMRKYEIRSAAGDDLE